MSDLMTFPNTVEEFMEQYKIIDTEQVYTNGAELVPIFRMKQWFEHLSTAEPSGGLVDRRVLKAHLQAIVEYYEAEMEKAAKLEVWTHRYHCKVAKLATEDVLELIDNLDTAQEGKKGKWVKAWSNMSNGCIQVDGYRCSKCNVLYPWATNYCPNCGEIMEVSE